MGPIPNNWRSAYEAYAAAAWLAGVACAEWYSANSTLPETPLQLLQLIGIGFGAERFFQALQVWRRRFALEGKPIEWITSDQVHQKALARPGHVWFGWGFTWGRTHTQSLYELERVDVGQLRVPFADVWRRCAGLGESRRGSPLLHGVEPLERDVYVSLADLEGHLFCPGSTGALKTRLLMLLAVQAIRRTPRETVIVLDPKGDIELRDFLRAECRAAGRERDFGFFHRACPQESFRLDCLANWMHTTQIASRIGALIPSESGTDPWSAFGWRVCNLVAEGCVATLGERPTLTTLRRYIEGGVDELLRRTLIQHFERQHLDWQTEVQSHLRNVTRQRLNAGTSAETTALVALYRGERGRTNAIGLLDGLISMWEHDHMHAQKMLASLLPVLTMLTAGDLASLLSPDRNDAADRRPILNGGSIADSGAVIYIGTDALSDSVVASAISSLFMADQTSHAGFRYNAGVSEPKVNLLADEANESLNLPFIQTLNKARKAGYRITFFSQTFSDFVARLGSEAFARQVLANANSVVAGRMKDKVTVEYVTEDFGRTILESVQASQGTNVVADGKLLNFTTSHGSRLAETLSEIVPPEALGRLPDLEYFATFTGSKIVKGRIPLVRSSGASS